MRFVINRKLEFSKLFFVIVACVVSLFILAMTVVGYVYSTKIINSLSYEQETSVTRSLNSKSKPVNKYSIEYADTPTKQITGLSGRSGLATSTVMLFTFDNEDEWGIWMKDMKFPIDVLWLDKNLAVSDTKENMMPASYPETFIPQKPVLYVLEAAAGFIKENNVKIGDGFTIVKGLAGQHDIIFKNN